MKRKLRMGMVGGGNDGFIGSVHRMAAFIDNKIELVCGCFSVNPEISIKSGHSYFVPENRIYTSYKEMFEKEKQLPENERMDFVTIVTPNFLHFEPAMMALDNGFNVVIDKPMVFSVDEAEKLKAKVEETGLTLALTHVYSGYPAIKEAKERIKRGDLGKIRKVYVDYRQGWLSERIEVKGGNNAGWRTDPKRSGKAGAMGDIGTHAWHLAEYVTGAKVTELCADVNTIVPDRLLDDDGAALLRFDNGVTGVLIATQVAAGEENNIIVRVYGEKGGFEWHQQQPNTLWLRWGDGRATEMIRVGNAYMSDTAKYNTRIPGGHPEGYIEAFANIYRNFALTVDAKLNNENPQAEWLDFPTVDDGLRGMQFIETIIESGKNNNTKWVKWIE